MSFEHKASIFYGVKVDKDTFFKDCFRFIEMKPISELRKATADYAEKAVEDVDGDDLWDYLHDEDYVIDCDFLDDIYVGDNYLTVGENDNCETFELEHLTKCSTLTFSIKEFISTLYPDKVAKLRLISWAL